MSAAASRCASCCCQQARPAAARRAHQPPRRRERAVARAAPRRLPRRRPRRHPRPVLPRQRRRSGSSSSTAAAPTPTRATTRPTWRRRPSASRSRARRTPSCRSGSRTSWSGCARTPRPARPRARRAWPATRRWRPRPSSTRKLDFEEIQIPPGPRLGNVVVEVDEPRQGLRRPRRSSRTCPSRCRATASSASSAPTASARPRCSRRSSAWRSPTAAPSRSARRSRSPTSTRAAAGIDPKKNVWEVVSDGLDYIKVGHVEMPVAGLRLAVRLQGPGPAEAGRRALRW